MTIVCFCCGREVKNGDFTAPWEDGNNPYAYITCPYCGYKNDQYGYGEDD